MDAVRRHQGRHWHAERRTAVEPGAVVVNLVAIAGFSLLLSLGVGKAAAGEPRGLESVGTAKDMILSGRSEEARALLQQLEARYPDNNDVDFLLGLLALEAGDHDRAIGYFRSILSRQPGAVRVRLELARALYLDRDYENAFRQFQFARAGNPPPGVVATIERFLSAIRQQKDWSYQLSFALAPDSNINSGTSAREATIFGLPFELSDDARRRSGVGIAVEAGAEFAPRIRDTARLRLGGALQRNEYKGSDLDDTTIGLHAGPRLVLADWDLSVTGTAFQRRFGRRRVSEGFGTRIEATHHSDSRTILSLGLAAHQIRYPHSPFHNGRAYSVWSGFARALTPESMVTARVAANRKAARADELASWSGSISAGYYRDLPAGFSVYLQPSYSRARYDAPDPFFGLRRRDNLLELRVGVLNRRLYLSGFTPRIGVTLARRRSTIDLYDYTQRRLEIGVTRAF